MASSVLQLAIFGFIASSVLAVPENCYSCVGKDDDCANVSKDDLEAAHQTQSCGTPSFATPFSTFPQVKGRSASDNVTRTFLDVIEKQLKPSFAADPILGETSCVKLTFTHPAIDDVTFAYRGCAPKSLLDKEICTILNHAVGVIAGDSDDCYSCSGELCNSGLNVFSRNSILLALLSSLLFKLLF